MARNGSNAGDLLQQRSDELSRAQERIDTNPEEALAALEPHVAIDQSGQLTLHDVLGLFVQMQQSQAAMQQQIVELLSRQGQVEQTRRTAAHSKEDIATAQEQQRRTLAVWKEEPRLPVYLEPTMDEKKVFAVVGEFPPRMHRVNGLEFPIKVGEVVNVPESIHAQITWAQGFSANRKKPAQPLSLIDDPERAQFLAGAQSVSAGRAGTVGEGPLLVPSLARTPDQAGPLDMRYDHEGR